MTQTSRLGRPKGQRSWKTVDPSKWQKIALDAASKGSGALTPAQLAGFLQVSVKTIDDMIKGGELPAVYIGSDSLVKKFPRLLIVDVLIFLDSISAINKI
jgi:excisionase family DNA binding protein